MAAVYPSIAIGWPVLAADGRLLGTVERIDVSTLKLARASTADGLPHDIPLDWVARAEGGTVHLSAMSTEEAALSSLGTSRGIRDGLKGALPWLLAAFGAIMLMAVLLAF